jgi:hypothetical protein
VLRFNHCFSTEANSYKRIIEMVEHRRLKRQLLRYYLWVFNKEDNLLRGHVGETTTEGVMLALFYTLCGCI